MVCQMRDWPKHKKLCGGKLEQSLDPVVWKWFQSRDLPLAEIRECTTLNMMHGRPMDRETVDWLNALETRLSEEGFVPDTHDPQSRHVGTNTALGTEIRASIIPFHKWSMRRNDEYCEVMFSTMSDNQRHKFNITDAGIRYFKTIDELMDVLCEIRGENSTLVKPARGDGG